MNRVLVVEDDDAIAVILEKRLQQRGFAVTRALDAKQAAERFRALDDIILILSDFDMGGGPLNGDALYENIKEELKERNVAFVILSAVIPQLLADRFTGSGIPVVEKWKLNKEFDFVIAPLLKAG